MTRAQLGSIERLGKDRYRVSIEGTRQDGKRKRVYKVVRGSRDDAEIELAKLKLAAGKPVTLDLTVDRYWEAYYKPSASVRVSKNTWNTYEHAYTKHLKPRFGDAYMDDLTARVIERELNTIDAPFAREQAFKVFRQIYNEAWSFDEVIETNPFLKRMRITRTRKKEPETLSLAELAQWSFAIRGFRFEACLLLIAFGGLRREEACALSWEDIRFERIEEENFAFIAINKAYPVTGMSVTKTERSDRTVVIPDPIATRLVEISLHGSICKKEEGSMVHPERVRVEYEKWRKSYEGKSVTMLRLRTTYATLHQQIGTDATVTSRALGHTKLATDYAHYFATNSAAYVAAASTFGDALKQEISK